MKHASSLPMSCSMAARAAVKSPRYQSISGRALSCFASTTTASARNVLRTVQDTQLFSSHTIDSQIPQLKQRRTPIQRRWTSDDASASDGGLSRTALHELHVENGGKMVPFGGFSMPVQYSDLSVGESHKWTREKASLFDVGHMYFPPLLFHFAGILW